MSEIILEQVTKQGGKFVGVDNLNMTIDDRAFVTLLDPSGCVFPIIRLSVKNTAKTVGIVPTNGLSIRLTVR